jgi:AraC-like DNA-binding protein
VVYFKTFKEINDLHKATGYPEKTSNPLFHVFNTSILPDGFIKAMPPYCQEYYQIGLNHDMTGTSFSLQSQNIDALNNLLFFVAPGQVITWEVAEITDGFLLYFKKEFLDFYRGDADKEFPFFRITDANYIRLSDEDSKELYSDLVRLRRTFEKESRYQQQQLQALTLAFLFKCKSLFEQFDKALLPRTRQLELFYRFTHLISRFYTEYRNMEEYAAILNITPNYLSSVVKMVSGKSPKRFLDDRLITESKNLLTYSALAISEIAFKLSFSEPTHFIRFFKKETGMTPAEFRLRNNTTQSSELVITAIKRVTKSLCT